MQSLDSVRRPPTGWLGGRRRRNPTIQGGFLGVRCRAWTSPRPWEVPFACGAVSQGGPFSAHSGADTQKSGPFFKIKKIKIPRRQSPAQRWHWFRQVGAVGSGQGASSAEGSPNLESRDGSAMCAEKERKKKSPEKRALCFTHFQTPNVCQTAWGPGLFSLPPSGSADSTCMPGPKIKGARYLSFVLKW